MSRTNLIVGLFLTMFLVLNGCAKKNMVDVQESPEPPVVETAEPSASEVVPAVVESVPPVVEVPPVAVDNGLETILFDYDSASLTAGVQSLLRAHAEWLKQNMKTEVIVAGHCDERGSDEYNLALGERRALVTKNYLTELGIAPDRLSIISYGEEKPVSGGHEEADWKQNRRAEFKIQL